MKRHLSALVGLLALGLCTWEAGAATYTFVSDTSIAVGNTTYDGQDIVVSNCTLTVDGAHPFNSLRLTNTAVLTHSPAPNGEAEFGTLIRSELAHWTQFVKANGLKAD